MKRSIWKFPELQDLIFELHGKCIVLAGGCFDIIHPGHIAFLEAASKAGEVLIVALESDEFIRTRKLREVVHQQYDRAVILSALKMVTHVVMLPFFKDDKEYMNLVTKIHPAVIAVTEGDPFLKKKQAQADIVGAQVREVSKSISGHSTSIILSNEYIHRGSDSTKNRSRTV